MEKVCCYDVDGTLAKGLLVVPLIMSEHDAGLIDKDVFRDIQKLLALYKSGQVSYERASELSMELHAKSLKGKHYDDVKAHAEYFVSEHNDLFHSFGNTITSLLRGIGKQVLATSETRYIAEAVAGKYNMDDLVATDYAIVDGKFTGEVQTSLANRFVKSAALNKYEIVYAFGDAESDIEMLKMAKYPVCVWPTDGLMKIAQTSGWPICLSDAEVINYVTRSLQ